MKRNGLIIAAFLALVLVSASLSYMIWKSGEDRIREVEDELAELRTMEKRSAVVRSVSKRMEEIAFHQKNISDQRREEAVQQAQIAQEMTRMSEIERGKAVNAEKEAKASERAAREAFEDAEYQRRQAEYAKRVADTLGHLNLGRSLGFRSQSLYQAGETELASLLAYASYTFAREYPGEKYRPSVYNALVMTSKSMVVKDFQNGEITKIEVVPGAGNEVMTVSILGDVYVHETVGGTIRSRCLYQNSRFRFVDLSLANDGTAYALSRTGQLVILHKDRQEVIPINNVAHPTYLMGMNGGTQLLIVGSQAMTVFDLKGHRFIGTQPLGSQVTCVSRIDGKPLLFDRLGKMHVVNSLRHLVTTQIPVRGTVTAFAHSSQSGISAYGTSDGNIFCVSKSGNTDHLVGHRSKITKIKMDGERLYSSSLDGQLNLWVLSHNKIEPLALIQSSQWIMGFALNQKHERIWAATANGSVIQHTISPDVLASIVRRRLKRDFTPEEWNYYIGSNIPYMSMMSNHK